MKLEQKIAQFLKDTEHLKHYVTRYDVMYADHDVLLFLKQIENPEVKYDLQDESYELEEEIGFTITFMDDSDLPTKNDGIPFSV